MASSDIGVDGTEVTMSNKPRDWLSDWFFEPVLNLKDQLRAAHLQESEEQFLGKLILMRDATARMGSWQNGGVEPEDAVRKGELQALARWILGITTSVSRVPTHRRRLENVMKSLQAYVENMENTGGNLSNQNALADKSKSMKKSRSYNCRSWMKEGSKPTIEGAERRGNPEEVSSNGDRAV